jgi:hypothetical protein
MTLSVLHAAIRLAARGGSLGGDAQLSDAERSAVNALRRRATAAGGDVLRLVPPAGTAAWVAKSEAAS